MDRRQSLKDLAKLAGTVSSPASRRDVKEDSGMIDFQALSNPAPVTTPFAAPSSGTATAATSAPSAPTFDAPPATLASASLPQPAAQAAQPMYAAQPTPHASYASIAPMAVSQVPSVPSPAYDAEPMYTEPKKKRGGAIFAIGGVAALAIVGAGAFFGVSKFGATKTAGETAAAKVEAQAPKKAAAVAQAPVDELDETPKAADSVDPSSLPNTHGAPKTAAKHGAKTASAPAIAAPEKQVDVPEAKPVKEEKKVAVPAGDPGSLSDAMKKAVGPTGEPVAAAKAEGPQFAPGTVPQKPSQGAVTSSLSKVMGAARACVTDDDTVTRATVTFASAGTVQGVNLSGAAAGKPAGECVKAALSQAKIAPFAESTYVTTVTVRH